MRLISGGRQCEEVKNITKHCTADELPPGKHTHFESINDNSILEFLFLFLRNKMADCGTPEMHRRIEKAQDHDRRYVQVYWSPS